MKSKEFCLKKIEGLVKIFPNIKCSYKESLHDDSHVIEIVPIKEFYDNKLLQDMIYDIDMEFIELFPHECIFILSSDVLHPFENPSHVNVGIEYTQEMYQSLCVTVSASCEPYPIGINIFSHNNQQPNTIIPNLEGNKPSILFNKYPVVPEVNLAA